MATIYMKHDGEIIAEKEVTIELEAGEELPDYVSSKEFNLTEKMWYDT